MEGGWGRLEKTRTRKYKNHTHTFKIYKEGGKLN